MKRTFVDSIVNKLYEIAGHVSDTSKIIPNHAFGAYENIRDTLGHHKTRGLAVVIMNTRENMGQSLVCLLLAGILLFAAQAHVHAGNWPVTPKDIRIKPGSDKWFEDNGKYPYLVGVYDSSPFSNFWGDPGKEFDPDGSRASNPVTHPCANGFLWSNYLDALLKETMDLGNVLYEINWEAGNGEWLEYWANYVKGKLAAAGRPKNLIIVNQDTRPCINL